MNRRWRWLWLGAAVATGALADIVPTSGLPFREDFESSALMGWTQNEDSANTVSVSFNGESWAARGALDVQCRGTLLPNASISTYLPSPINTLSVRFFLYVPEKTRMAMGAASIRLLNANGLSVVAAATLDLKTAGNVLYLSPTVATVNVDSPAKASLTTGVYHYVELTMNGDGTSALYIDDPRVPRVRVVADASATDVSVGISGQLISTASLRVLYDDLQISNRHVGLADTRILTANEYESPGLSFDDSPAGKAALVLDAGTPVPQLLSQTTDVHRGSRAMTVIDQDPSTSTQGVALGGFLDRGTPKAVYRRVWWRWPTGSSGHTVLAILDSDGGTAPSARMRFTAAVQIQDGGAARLWGMNDQGTITYAPEIVPLMQGPWHLLELYAGGFGSNSGERQGWADGVSLGRELSLPFLTMTGDAWGEGVLPGPGEGPYVGADSFDDARSSDYVQPSHFVLLPNGPTGGCDWYDVVATTSGGVGAPVPENADVALDGGGQAVFFSGPNCSNSSFMINSVRFDAGSPREGVYVLSTTPSPIFSTSSPDYLPWSNGAAPDAGGPGPASRLALRGMPEVAIANFGYPFAVEALDGAGVTAETYTGTVSIVPTPSATLPSASHSFTMQDRGYFVFGGGVTFPLAGTYVVSAVDTPSMISGNSSVRVLAQGQLAIIRDSNFHAVAGRPYRYNSFGTVTVVSTAGAPTFSTCNGLPGFTVDSRSGAVRWVPPAPGLYAVCVQANAGLAQDQWRFDVDVVAVTPGPPDAGFVVRWSPVQAGGFVVDDPVGTQSQLGLPIFRWRFGDGAWPGTDPQPFHRFVLPGGYRTHQTVWDSAGQSAAADQPVQAGLARLAPTVRITSAQPLEGDDQVSATLHAEVATAAGQAVVAYRWDLGDGTSVSGTLASGQTVPDAPVTYQEGRWFPQLLVVDGTGLTATDKVEVVVSKDGVPPPECLATIEPTAVSLTNASPVLGARFRAFELPSSAPLKDTNWTVDGQGQPQDQAVIPQTYDAGGWHHGELTVRDEAGLLCRDSVDLPVLAPIAGLGIAPRIVDPGGGVAACGKALDAGAPVAADPGNLGVTWSLVSGPGGAGMDGQGRLLWTPPVASTAPGSFVVRATNSAGSDQARVSVAVDCTDVHILNTCSCGAGGGAPFAALAALHLLARRRRRQRLPLPLPSRAAQESSESS